MESKIYQSLDQIPNLAWEGYIWLSDKTEPTVLHKDTFNFNSLSKTSFVVEALLYHSDSQESIHVQYTGAYQISGYNLKAIASSDAELKDCSYLPHRLGEGVKAVQFKQVWEDENDALCNDFPVKTLVATVFCGLKK